MDALYLPHYTLAKRRILSYSTEHIDLTGKTKDEVAATLVTLRECRTRSAAGKLANLLAQTSRIDAMRLFVDVVSFYALGVVPTLGPVEEIDAALAAVDVQLYESALAASTRDPLRAGAREWSDALFEAHRDDRRMPFFFQPFFWQSPSGAGPADARTDEVDRVARFIVAVGRWVSQRTSL